MTDAHPGSTRRELTAGDSDALVREEPLVIKIGEQQVLTMRTPGDDLHLAIGFLLSEGAIASVDDIERHEITAGDPTELRADTIELFARKSATASLQGRLTRTHEIRTSCGICGLTDPDELLETTPPLLGLADKKQPNGVTGNRSVEWHGRDCWESKSDRHHRSAKSNFYQRESRF